MELLTLIIEPVSTESAQVGTICVLALTFVDVFTGSLSAVLHNEFQSHILREGLIRKVQNFLLMVAALFVDAALLSGLDLPFSPCYLAICTALCVMEVRSLVEIWNKDHPEVGNSIGDIFGVDDDE